MISEAVEDDENSSYFSKTRMSHTIACDDLSIRPSTVSLLPTTDSKEDQLQA